MSRDPKDPLYIYDPSGRMDMNDPHDVCLMEWMIYRDNPIGLITQEHLMIKTKDGELAPLKPSKSQQFILDSVQEKRRKHLPVRIGILKARQTYTSTICEAIMYVFCTIRGVTQGLVIADDDEGASDIFKMNETFYEEMKRTMPHLTPQRKRSDERRMEFDKKKSAIRIDTARNKQAGRKYTYRMVHGTECAFWPDFKNTLKSLMPSVPEKKETIVMFETTSNGKNDFYKWWMKQKQLGDEARKKGEESLWVLIFIGWNMHEEYVREFRDEKDKKKFMESLSSEEREMQKQFKLSPEQLNWRRHTLNNSFSGDVESFSIEFPLTEKEAFQSTSQNVFPDKMLEPQRSYIQEPQLRGDMIIIDKRPVFTPDSRGFLKIFKPVQAEFQYVIGADSCESALTHDEACAHVMCRNTWEQAAHIHGHIDPRDFAKMLFAVGMYYNMATIAAERNSPGLVTNSKLAELMYPRILRTPRMVITDGGKWEETEEFGFHTNVKTKPIIRDGLRDGLRDLLPIIHEAQTIDQLSTYVVLGVNKDGYADTGAEEGYYDDCVAALMIALHSCRQVRIVSGEKQEVARPIWNMNGRNGY